VGSLIYRPVHHDVSKTEYPFIMTSAKRNISEKECNFSIKITHFYAYFSQNTDFKAITH